MASTNWNNGQLITMNPGDTAICQELNAGQLYALMFYNSAQNAAGAQVAVVWSNSQPPVTVQVPGTTANQGLASVLFVNGSDTTTISAAMLQNQPGAKIQTYIASVKMPMDTTGIDNLQLPADGQVHLFQKFTRFYSVPASHWYQAQINSNVNQFMSIQFSNQAAIVNVLNSTVDPSPLVQAVGQAVSQYKINTTQFQTLSWPLQGNGQQIVFVNADSIQNSAAANISLQSLSQLYNVT